MIPILSLYKKPKLPTTHEKIEIIGFEIIEHERATGAGGLLTAVKKSFKIINNEPYISRNNEIIKTTIELDKDKTLTIINMDNPRSYKIDLLSIEKEIHDNAIIIGDVNCKHQLWGSKVSNIGGNKPCSLITNNSKSNLHKPSYKIRRCIRHNSLIQKRQKHKKIRNTNSHTNKQ